MNIASLFFSQRATRFGKTSVVRVLLEKGASVTAINNSGSTPLHLACEYGHLEIVKVHRVEFIFFSKISVYFNLYSCILISIIEFPLFLQ